MDPQTSKSQLASLPGAILALLFNGATSSLALQLWKCGDTLLSPKICQFITHVDLQDGRYASTSRLPKFFLYSLQNLRSLTLNRGGHWLLGSEELLIDFLTELDTSKLESLTLNSAESSNIFFDDHLASADDLPGQLLDLSTKFPNLRSLRFIATESVDKHHNLPRLPPNLTHLTTPLMTLDSQSGPIFANLPRSLESWESKFVINRMNMTQIEGLTASERTSADLRRIFANAPPSLTKLGVLGPEKLSIHEFDFLPKTIQNISIAALSLSDPMIDLPTLPLYLSSLTISHMPVNPNHPIEWIAFLPQQLKSLNIRFLAHQPRFAATSLLLLPPTLTSLTFSGIQGMQPLIDWSATGRGSFSALSWPIGLSSLLLADEPLSQPIVDRMIPPSLTQLSCAWKDEPFRVPRNLKSLTLHVPHASLWESTSRIMPSTRVDTPPSTASKLKLSTLGFSSRLTKLELVAGYLIPITILDDIYLPHLDSLRFSSWSADSLAKLPRTLISFKCGKMRNIPGPDVLNLGDIFADLPPHLKTLLMWRGDHSVANIDIPFSRLCFSSTPKLESLTLYGFGTFESAVLKNLPALRPSESFLKLSTRSDDDVKELTLAHNYDPKFDVKPQLPPSHFDELDLRQETFPDPRALLPLSS